MASPRDTFTLKSAAARAGVSVSTMRRRKSELEAAGATVDPSGWVIPLHALKVVFGVSDETPNESTPDAELVTQLRSENEFLRSQVERQSDLIEQQARAIERQSEAHAVISAQLTKLGQLEAGTATPAPTRDEQPAPRRRWWQRR